MPLAALIIAIVAVVAALRALSVARAPRALPRHQHCPPDCAHQPIMHLFLRGLYQTPGDDYGMKEGVITLRMGAQPNDKVLLLITMCGQTWDEPLRRVNAFTYRVLSPEERIVQEVLES